MEKILSFYEFQKRDSNLFVKGQGDWMFVGKNQNTVFTFGEKFISEEDVDEKIKSGQYIRKSGAELYQYFFGWDEEELCKQLNGYSLKTKKYLDACKVNIGFVKEEHGYDEDELIEKYQGFLDGLDITGLNEYGKNTKGEWVYQYSVRTDIDDYDITRLYFSTKPTKSKVDTAIVLAKIRLRFCLSEGSEDFQCWECGCRRNWLDIPGSLQDKWNGLQEKYCGC